jgi:GAF domain-containing protein
MADLTTLHEDLARVALVGRALDEVLSDITTIARKAMPAVDAVSITLIRGEQAFTAAYDGQMAMDADELQYERGYGPCMDAGRAGQILVIDDMTTEDRWPDYTPRAVEHGVGSSLSVPLPFQSGTIGALNTYSAQPRAYSEEDRQLGEQVASWIALAVGNAEAVARTTEQLNNLQIAMKSRAVIEQAKGMLMERYKVDEDRAFAVLIRASQTDNTKLRDVADELVRTGVLRGVG